MTLETWFAFVAASAVLLVIPGPTVMLVLSYALGQGWRGALPVALGVALGDFCAMTASLLGLGAVLATSAVLFTAVKWVGAAYLVWLGIRLWRAGASFDAEPRREPRSAVRMLGHAWLVTLLNPKAITFFVAFLPQFLDAKAPLLPQLSVVEPTFLALAFANALAYAGLASRLRRLTSSIRAVRRLNRVGGSLLVGAGLASIAVRPSA